MNAEDFLEFRKKIGIGVILQQMSQHHGIEYIILQDSIGILAASEQIDTVESINSSSFLQSSLINDSTYSRIKMYSGYDVYEVVKRFMLDDELIGIYRLGVSLKEIKNVEDRMLRRLILISLILAAISIIVLSIIFTMQNLKSISTEYQKFKTLTSSVLENMSEAVIVLDSRNTITLFNKSAETLFKINSKKVLGENITSFENGLLSFLEIKENGEIVSNFEKEIQLNGEEKYLEFSISLLNEPETNQNNYTIVIKDSTETKRFEEEAKRNEKLSAMGELASGVAHEIRNPINAIGMIAQRLNKEFSPTANQNEYSDITQLLKTEVDRINKIITQFLSYAKPIGLNPKSVELKSFFEEIFLLFQDQAKQKEINFILLDSKSINVNFDVDLVKQSLMNIIQNAFDAVEKGGEVTLQYSRVKNDLVIQISDNGIGIPPEQQKKIFDLYFTSKKEGNGLGLSISQKIISQHKGSISISSEVNKGTTFKINLPMQ